MAKVTNHVGVDASKNTLDIAIKQAGGHYLHKKVKNNEEGFDKIYALLPEACCVVMEATGSYYMPLAYHLHKRQIKVSIANPLTVNHFRKMRMSRAKTDKKDAAMIAAYGESEDPRLWKPKAAHLAALRQMAAILDNLARHTTSPVNQKEAFACSGQMTDGVSKMLEEQIEQAKSSIKETEHKMYAIGEEHHAELLANPRSIPSIGKQAALMLLIITDGFTKFDNAKELACYGGLCPRLYESGTSAKGKSRICKMGMSRIRQLLYLCAMSAIRVNVACKIMHERLKRRGKNGKLAIVAVASKLLRQSFAVGMGNKPYNPKIVAN